MERKKFQDDNLCARYFELGGSINYQSLDAYKIRPASDIFSKTLFGSDYLKSELKSFFCVKSRRLIYIKVDEWAKMEFFMEDLN